HSVPVRSARRSLEPRAETDRELDVGSGGRQVQERADHAPVLLLVHSHTFSVLIQRRRSAHRSRHGTEIPEVEFLEHVLGVLGLVDEGAIPGLLDVQPEEELKLTHHRHLKLPAHVIRKARNKRVRGATKDNIIHVNLYQQKISTMPEEKQRLIYRSHDKPLFKQKRLSTSHTRL